MIIIHIVRMFLFLFFLCRHLFVKQSFIFPSDAGYPLEAKTGRYYLMETHYSDSNPPKDLESLHADPIVDNSGLKLYYTSVLRKHDAGVLSIGKFYSRFFFLFFSSFFNFSLLMLENIGIFTPPFAIPHTQAHTYKDTQLGAGKKKKLNLYI